MVIFDTNIIIDHIRQRNNKASYFFEFIDHNPKELWAMSIVTIQELYVGKSMINQELEQYVLSVISPLNILPYTYQVAKLAGEIDRSLQRTIEFPDAVIAATAILNEAKLFTLNRKDFEGIKDLELVSLKNLDM